MASWFHAALEMGAARLSINKVNSLEKFDKG